MTHRDPSAGAGCTRQAPAQGDLFAANAPAALGIGPAAVILRGFAREHAAALLDALQAVAFQAPFRNMMTPGGRCMSVAMTNCGAAGWTTDARGYRYTASDPVNRTPWPAMPPLLEELGERAAAAAGFPAFAPDACLVNRYAPGTRLSLHQDRDERDYAHPIVSFSLGLPARFLWGGERRNAPVARLPLAHGDVVVWGGPDRLRFHGIDTLAEGDHPLTGHYRYNLTLRRAL